MHGFILIPGSQKEIDKLSTKLGAKILEFPVSTIKEVRELSKFTSLSVAEPTAILAPNIDEATVPAQNALLKNLEEPQNNLYFILTANLESKILPTILSRCNIIRSKTQIDISEDDINNANNFLKLKTGGKLEVTSKITKREDAVDFLENLINVWHEDLSNNLDLANCLEAADEALMRIKANGNVQLQLTNFVMEMEWGK